VSSPRLERQHARTSCCSSSGAAAREGKQQDVLTVLSSGPSTRLDGACCAVLPSVKMVTRRPAAQANDLAPGATVRWLTL